MEAGKVTNNNIAKYVSEYGTPKIPKDTEYRELNLDGITFPDDLVNTAVEEANALIAEERAKRQSEQ